mgnify:CR=1 FL=1|jgi:hypothetical protein
MIGEIGEGVREGDKKGSVDLEEREIDGEKWRKKKKILFLWTPREVAAL